MRRTPATRQSNRIILSESRRCAKFVGHRALDTRPGPPGRPSGQPVAGATGEGAAAAKRASALRTTAGSVVVHIGGRLAWRKPP